MQDIDRSYLSQPEVVEASRKWTCIRLATYENKEEAEYLAGIFRGRSGQLENTVFTFMNPQATEHLIQPGRGPRQQFRGPADMAREMDRLALSFAQPKAESAAELPKVESVKLALNIAACEGLPVIVVTSDKVERRLLGAARDRRNLGQAVYVREASSQREGAWLLQPDKFGMKVLNSRELDPDISAEELANLLAAYQSGPKDHRLHVLEGFRKGIRWETAVPVTDPRARY